MKKLFLVVSILVLFLCLTACNKKEKEKTTFPLDGEGNVEGKILWKGTIEDDFTDNEILFVVDKNFNKKEITKEDFPKVDIEKIEQLTSTNWKSELPFSNQNVYRLTLKEKGKQKVIDSIRKIEGLDFVKQATPNLAFNDIPNPELEKKWEKYNPENQIIKDHPQTGEYYNVMIKNTDRIITPKDFPGLEIEEIKYDFSKIDIAGEYCGFVGKFYFLYIKLKNYQKYDITTVVKTLKELEFVRFVAPVTCDRNLDVTRDSITFVVNKEAFDRDLVKEDFPDLKLSSLNKDVYEAEEGPIYYLCLEEKGRKSVEYALDILKTYNFVYFAEESLFPFRCLFDDIEIEVKKEYENHEFTIEDFPDLELEEIIKKDELHYTLVTRLKGCKYVLTMEDILNKYDFIESYKGAKDHAHVV